MNNNTFGLPDEMQLQYDAAQLGNLMRGGGEFFYLLYHNIILYCGWCTECLNYVVVHGVVLYDLLYIGCLCLTHH